MTAITDDADDMGGAISQMRNPPTTTRYPETQKSPLSLNGGRAKSTGRRRHSIERQKPLGYPANRILKSGSRTLNLQHQTTPHKARSP